MDGWASTGMEDDLRPRMFAARVGGRPFALATIVAADGGPRPVGAQLLVFPDGAHGYLSGGCVEADVALHARAALADGEPRRLVYGRGSPFVDMRLPCGGRLEVLVERVAPDDPALAELERLATMRHPAAWSSDGRTRRCVEGAPGPGDLAFDPAPRLCVVGHDPFALAIAEEGARAGWETTLVAPDGPATPPPLPVAYSREPAGAAVAALRPDRWTAIAAATHDPDQDHDALVAALGSDAGYVGVLGARRRLPERLARLRAAGVDEARLADLRAPIGLPIGAASAREVAVSVVAELVAHRRGASR